MPAPPPKMMQDAASVPWFEFEATVDVVCGSEAAKLLMYVDALLWELVV